MRFKGNQHTMTPKHIVAILALVLVGYLLGVKFPSVGSAALAKVGV